MPRLVIPRPSEKQRQFMADRHKYVGYGGARGRSGGVLREANAVVVEENHCDADAGGKALIVGKGGNEHP